MQEPFGLRHTNNFSFPTSALTGKRVLPLEFHFDEWPICQTYTVEIYTHRAAPGEGRGGLCPLWVWEGGKIYFYKTCTQYVVYHSMVQHWDHNKETVLHLLDDPEYSLELTNMATNSQMVDLYNETRINLVGSYDYFAHVIGGDCSCFL